MTACGGTRGRQPAVATPSRSSTCSYDPTRELYREFDVAFAELLEEQDGSDRYRPHLARRFGQPGTRAVIDGLEADVVTLALAFDIDAIANAGLTEKGWQKRLPHNSTPYTSTIVFLVRKGNPKNIKDWVISSSQGSGHHAEPQDVGRGAVELPGGVAVRAHPRWNDTTARDFVSRLYKNVPVLDAGARGSTNTFAQRGIGDVLLAWENEAYLAVAESKGQFDIVAPPRSILAEPPVAVVDQIATRRGTTAVAQAYLETSASPEGQEIAASTTTGRAIPTSSRNTEPPSPTSSCSRSATRSAAGRRPARALRERRDLRSDLSARQK